MARPDPRRHRGHELLRQLEHLLVAERAHPDLFATCTLLTLDSHAHKATLHMAGHHEPLLTTNTGTQEVSASHGIALGIAAGPNHWPATDLTLPPTGALTLYTDGLVEGLRLESSERLGIDGLLTLVNALPATEPETHIAQLIAAVNTHNAHRHTDDVAVLRLDWSTPATLGDDRLSDTQPHEAITT